jgi:hypothetical protein
MLAEGKINLIVDSSAFFPSHPSNPVGNISAICELLMWQIRLNPFWIEHSDIPKAQQEKEWVRA